MDIKFLPGWGPSKNAGNPTRVINDNRLTVLPYPENPNHWTHVVGGIFAPPGTSYVTADGAQAGAERQYTEFLANGTVMSSERAWRMESMNRPSYGYRAPRNFADEYRKTQKKGDVNIFVVPNPAIPDAAVLSKGVGRPRKTAIEDEL